MMRYCISRGSVRIGGGVAEGGDNGGSSEAVMFVNCGATS